MLLNTNNGLKIKISHYIFGDMPVLKVILTLVMLLTAGTALAQTTSNVNTDSKSNSTVTTDADTKM